MSGTDALIDGQAIASAFNLNVTAVMLLTARFLAAVEDLPADRRVLNISSGAGRNPCRLGRVLRHQGGAGHVLARGQAGTGRDGARVVSLAPGIVDTDMQVAIRSSDPAHFPALSSSRNSTPPASNHSPANVATRILAYLDRDDFGTAEIDDIHNTTDPPP